MGVFAHANQYRIILPYTRDNISPLILMLLQRKEKDGGWRTEISAAVHGWLMDKGQDRTRIIETTRAACRHSVYDVIVMHSQIACAA